MRRHGTHVCLSPLSASCLSHLSLPVCLSIHCTMKGGRRCRPVVPPIRKEGGPWDHAAACLRPACLPVSCPASWPRGWRSTAWSCTRCLPTDRQTPPTTHGDRRPWSCPSLPPCGPAGSLGMASWVMCASYLPCAWKESGSPGSGRAASCRSPSLASSTTSEEESVELHQHTHPPTTSHHNQPDSRQAREEEEEEERMRGRGWE